MPLYSKKNRRKKKRNTRRKVNKRKTKQRYNFFGGAKYVKDKNNLLPKYEVSIQNMADEIERLVHGYNKINTLY